MEFCDERLAPADCGRSVSKSESNKHLGSCSSAIVLFVFSVSGNDFGVTKSAVDEEDDDGCIVSECSLVSNVLVLFVIDSDRSGNDVCCSRLICDARLLWYNVSSSLSTSIFL